MVNLFCDRKGFSLIEIVMIIVILGILAAVAIPKYYSLQADAQNAAEKSVVGRVRSGIYTYYAQNRSWPSQLDNAANSSTASNSNLFFNNVLAQDGITDDWSKNSAGRYVGPANTVYAYDSSDGTFDEFSLVVQAEPIPIRR